MLMTLKHIYRPILALVLGALTRFASMLPRGLALRVGEGLGAVGYHLFGAERRRMMANLTLAFGRARPRRDIVRMARDCFKTLGRSAFDTLRLPSISDEEISSVVDSDPLGPAERVLARGKGLIIITSHIGAWELGVAYLGARLGRPLYTIGRRIYFEPYNNWLVHLRRCHGLETIYQDAGARPALRLLRSNHTLCLLADQDVERLDGVFVDFFGSPAYTPTAPAAFARASGAGMVPIFITWNGRRHRVHVLPELELARTGDRKADDAENTRRWSSVVEGIIRRHPEQWVWFHRRWRSVGGASKEGG